MPVWQIYEEADYQMSEKETNEGVVKPKTGTVAPVRCLPNSTYTIEAYGETGTKQALLRLAAELKDDDLVIALGCTYVEGDYVVYCTVDRG